MSRLKVVAGNWKMYKNLAEVELFASQFVQKNEKKCIIVPPFIYLDRLKTLFSSNPLIKLGAQNCYTEKEGAFTGEVSPEMLVSIGVDYVILGHSERRQMFFETDALLATKVSAVLRTPLTPIFCIGESLEVREANAQNAFVEQQLVKGLFHLSPADFSRLIIAYEPIWAIGTGKTASPDQAQEIHAHIRSVIAAQYGHDTANATTILYGGSVKPNNAAELFGKPDVDGGLVGGASLSASDFEQIVAVC